MDHLSEGGAPSSNMLPFWLSAITGLALRDDYLAGRGLESDRDAGLLTDLPYKNERTSAQPSQHELARQRDQERWVDEARLEALGKEIIASAGAARQTEAEKAQVSPHVEYLKKQQETLKMQEQMAEREAMRKEQEYKHLSELAAAEAQTAMKAREEASRAYKAMTVQTSKDSGRETSLIYKQKPTLTEEELEGITFYPDEISRDQNLIYASGLSARASELPTEIIGARGDGMEGGLGAFGVTEADMALAQAIQALQLHCKPPEIEMMWSLMLQAYNEVVGELS